jgi:hypothetical protein
LTKFLGFGYNEDASFAGYEKRETDLDESILGVFN